MQRGKHWQACVAWAMRRALRLAICTSLLSCAAGRPALADGPTITWHTFLGSIESDEAAGVVVDDQGNVYVVGHSGASWGNPIRPFAQQFDGFVAKLSPTGELLWHTFLGGNGSDFIRAIALDATGHVYVCGRSSTGWGNPVRPSAVADGFVAKLTADGALVWNTFLGGVSVDSTSGIAVDPGGEVSVVGTSPGPWEGMISGTRDAFVARLAPDGVLLWHRFLGNEHEDNGGGIATDADGNVYVTGLSQSSWGAPIRPFAGGSFYDAFVAKLTPTGTLTWNTFLGGAGGEEGRAIDVDADGNIYVLGSAGTEPWGEPLRAPSGWVDGFVAKLIPTGDLAWNTFLGGPDFDGMGTLKVDGAGDIYVSGSSSAAWGSPLLPYSGERDGVLARLAPDGELIWNLFIGSINRESLSGVAVDAGGAVIVCGISNAPFGNPLRPHSGAYGEEAFVMQIDIPPLPTRTPTATDTPTPTATPTVTETNTATATATRTETVTPTPSVTASATSTPTATATASATATPTASVTATPTATATDTPTATPTATLAGGCPVEPASTCHPAGKSVVQLRDHADPARRRFTWKWVRGLDALTRDDFGDPVLGSTTYSLCLYDQVGGLPVLRIGLALPAAGTCAGAPCWRTLGSRGWSYRDNAGSTAGVTRFRLRGGPAGRPSVQLKGAGALLPIPPPNTAGRYFAQDGAVILQLHASSPAACWSSTFTASRRNDGRPFKATAP